MSKRYNPRSWSQAEDDVLIAHWQSSRRIIHSADAAIVALAALTPPVVRTRYAAVTRIGRLRSAGVLRDADSLTLLARDRPANPGVEPLEPLEPTDPYVRACLSWQRVVFPGLAPAPIRRIRRII